jgi:hypothetical protein
MRPKWSKGGSCPLSDPCQFGVAPRDRTSGMAQKSPKWLRLPAGKRATARRATTHVPVAGSHNHLLFGEDGIEDRLFRKTQVKPRALQPRLDCTRLSCEVKRCPLPAAMWAGSGRGQRAVFAKQYLGGSRYLRGFTTWAADCPFAKVRSARIPSARWSSRSE